MLYQHFRETLTCVAAHDLEMSFTSVTIEILRELIAMLP